MTDKDVIRELMRANGVSSPVLAKRMGYKTASGVTEKFRRTGSMQLDTFVKFVTALNGTVVVRHGDADIEINFDAFPKDGEA
jgi:hypothetical protein